MRIGIDARELSGQATGVGRYLQRLLQEWGLAAVAHQWILYSPDGRLAVPPGLRAEVAVVPGRGGTRWEQRALAAAIRRDAPDVFFAPAYSAPLRLAVPLVLALHDVSFAAHPEWYRWREGLRRRWLAKASARQARAILTISAFSRDEIVRHLGVPGARIHVVPLGVGLPAPAAPDLSREPLVLFVGSLFTRRHLPALIEAFARLADRRGELRLEIVGANRTHPFLDVQALARATPTGSRIRIRDWVDDAELRVLYAQASAFAFLSEYEGFGLTPLEALAHGVPPVVLDTPVAREVLGEAALYVTAPDPDEVAKALDEALGPGAARERVLGEAAATLGRYDWRRAAAGTLAVIEAAAGS